MTNNNKQIQYELSEYKKSLNEKDKTILSLKKEVEELTQKLNDKTIENQLTKNAYLGISESKFWKITLPLQNLLDKIRGTGAIEETMISDEQENKQLLNDCDNIIFLTTVEGKYYCELIQSVLKERNISCEIIFEEPPKYNDQLYFVVCSEEWNHLPEKYIALQLKQIYNTVNLSEKYLDQLLNSEVILDYSTLNIQYIKNKSSYGNQFYYVPFDVLENQEEDSDYKYDILGVYINLTPRVEELQNRINILGKTKFIDFTNEDINEYIKESKVIIPLKSSENALLDTNTIYHVLAKKTSLIISENSEDSYECENLKDCITFVGSMDELVEQVKNVLENQEQFKELKQRQNQFIGHGQFEYFFYRFLLAYDCISFDEFYERCGSYVTFEGNRICLSLPEDVDRRNEFKKDNQYGFEFFPGLRHKRGWTGCGMSYKFIMKKAKEQDFQELIVCEDDVFFPEDFKMRFENCINYLHQNHDWDIFQGIMADIGDVTIQSIVKENDQTFVKLDHMMSMVFNIYTSSMFDWIIAWDEKNDDLKTNTIDRALESKELKVLTTIPFLVGHKEDLKSTIWGFDNTEYKDWLQRSSKKLEQLVKEKLMNDK